MNIKEIKTNPQPNFKRIIASEKAKILLKERLKTSEMESFYKLIREQLSNKNNVYLDTFLMNNKTVLTGAINTSPNIYCEDFCNTKLSPLAFIEKLCKASTDISKLNIDDLLKMI